jgi:hypothetical protein
LPDVLGARLSLVWKGRLGSNPRLGSTDEASARRTRS